MTDSLGLWLRRTREARRLDLQDVEKVLRIRRRYLQALEVGDYEALPGGIQARGFLRNYARYLGLPTEDVLARFDAEISGKPVQPRLPEIELPASGGLRTWAPPPPTAEEERVAVRANTSGGLVRILGAMLLFFALVAAASFAWLRFGAQDDVLPDLSVSAATATPGSAASPVPTTVPTPVFPVAEDGLVRIRIVAQNRAWISVSSDAEVIFQGVAEPQQVIEASAAEIVVVSTGNGSSFQLYVNGTDWGALGGQGEVVRRAWTPQGETTLEDS
jgi:cytoskeletal protein RodZ